MTNFPSAVKWVHIHETASGDTAAGGNVLQSANDNYEAPETICKKMLDNIKGVIFDFDGTLFDNAFIAFHLIAAFPPDLLRIRRERLVRKHFAGCDYLNPEMYHRAFFTELGRPFLRSVERMRSWYFDRYMPRMTRVLKKHYKPRPGLLAFFKQIDNPASVTKMAVYSDYPFLKERMEALSIFTSERIRLYSPESFGAQKPAVRPFLEIAKEMNLSPEEILVIGDREETDGLGAFGAGMHFFCLETGRRRYFRLDPYRRKTAEEPHGPTMLMYAGAWESLIELLIKTL